jgi:RHH-type proline utilization regulon transcriptional repressor/proline dehydrogenase/delta 1-pyrroline-5-carboxylate dehydrogenase
VHSRIQSFVDTVGTQARVGNVYVNRSMIGAVVGVQPFGGEGLSGTGPKAGGPHYLFRFATERSLTVNTAAVGGVTELLTRPSI